MQSGSSIMPRKPRKPRKTKAGSEGQESSVQMDHSRAALTPGDLIEDIRALHRKEVYALKQRNRQIAALGAFIRTQLGWTRDLPDAESKRIKAKAAAILKQPDDTEFEEFVGATV